MKSIAILLVIVYADVSYMSGPVPMASCDGDPNSNRDEFKIPCAMSLSDFVFYYAWNGVQMSEMYYVYQNPKPFEPYSNYRINYTLIAGGLIQQDVIADDLDLPDMTNAQCIQLSAVMTPVVMNSNSNNGQVATANFRRSDSQEMQTFWTSCPSKYVWSMYCRDWTLSDRFCPVSKVSVELLIPKVGPNGPDNLPWSAMLNDLKKANMVFGSDYLYWAYTYGKSILCT